MTSFGVRPEGFVEKTIQTVLDEIETDEKAAFGAAPTSPSTHRWAS